MNTIRCKFGATLYSKNKSSFLAFFLCFFSFFGFGVFNILLETIFMDRNWDQTKWQNNKKKKRDRWSTRDMSLSVGCNCYTNYSLLAWFNYSKIGRESAWSGVHSSLVLIHEFTVGWILFSVERDVPLHWRFCFRPLLPRLAHWR